MIPGAKFNSATGKLFSPAQPILYWGDTSDLIYDPPAPYRRHPEDFVGGTYTVPSEVVNAVVRFLDKGKIVISYMGYAACRICGVDLGTSDMMGGKWIWPQKTSHYVTAHDVWTPEHKAIGSYLIENGRL